MGTWFMAVIGIMAVIIIALFVKIHLLQRAAEEIEHAFADRLMADTNTLIDLSCNDRHMRSLANAINLQLQKLQKQRRQFQQGDMELKNAVMNLSHDLRTPLTAICGYLDMLEEEEKTKTAERYLAVIRNRAQVMTQLTEELFQYSMVLAGEDKLNAEPVAINRVLEESIAAFYASLKKQGVTPKIQIPEKKVIRMLDRTALARVFANLLQNAIKYSEGDLDIVLSETGEITFCNKASGLSKVQAHRLFDRFYTVETARTSTGLGLSIAKTLVSQMNGTISAEYENHRLSICIYFSD
ncbi:HAMP domain-containing histidine kinase [Petralouisia muris]|uniref:HAMP domain-containing histidine kinase n=1 Tax=Petralouisia muris TaxID=3032872 RepID=A0AC61RYY2_9FIRM|nr:HAMP domain-containing sensor histidine kinase [Petralouisia muris]TGY96975.1 HAMP domain-containing histidine kinase [Petralouisia muris]